MYYDTLTQHACTEQRAAQQRIKGKPEFEPLHLNWYDFYGKRQYNFYPKNPHEVSLDDSMGEDRHYLRVKKMQPDSFGLLKNS